MTFGGVFFSKGARIFFLRRSAHRASALPVERFPLKISPTGPILEITEGTANELLQELTVSKYGYGEKRSQHKAGKPVTIVALDRVCMRV